MATLNKLPESPCKGKIISYSREIDPLVEKLQGTIAEFKAKKVAELLKENPFNLSTKAGIILAQKEISKMVETEISQLASPIFKRVQGDIASSVLIGFIQQKSANE